MPEDLINKNEIIAFLRSHCLDWEFRVDVVLNPEQMGQSYTIRAINYRRVPLVLRFNVAIQEISPQYKEMLFDLIYQNLGVLMARLSVSALGDGVYSVDLGNPGSSRPISAYDPGTSVLAPPVRSRPRPYRREDSESFRQMMENDPPDNRVFSEGDLLAATRPIDGGRIPNNSVNESDIREVVGVNSTGTPGDVRLEAGQDNVLIGSNRNVAIGYSAGLALGGGDNIIIGARSAFSEGDVVTRPDNWEQEEIARLAVQIADRMPPQGRIEAPRPWPRPEPSIVASSAVASSSHTPPGFGGRSSEPPERLDIQQLLNISPGALSPEDRRILAEQVARLLGQPIPVTEPQPAQDQPKAGEFGGRRLELDESDRVPQSDTAG